MNHIHEFFAEYSQFDYNPDAPFLKEFRRLSREMRWSREETDTARDFLREAMVHQFQEMYGTNVDDLRAWQLLCSALGEDPPPETIAECRKVSKIRDSFYF